MEYVFGSFMDQVTFKSAHPYTTNEHIKICLVKRPKKEPPVVESIGPNGPETTNEYAIYGMIKKNQPNNQI